ncbi:hypothetical protein BROUX41_004684 [Berkeleyomyces rouxiae]
MDAAPVTYVAELAELESNSPPASAPRSAPSSATSSASVSRPPSLVLADQPKTPISKSVQAVDRLPDEIIHQILTVADPNTFASLSLLDRRWHRISQQASLYALKLSQCLSFVASHESFSAGPSASHDLPRLRRLFALQAKQNLFDAYLRPSITEIKLISNTISSASAPAGEGLQFCPSPQGHHLLAYNSSRIYVIDVRQEDAKVARELATLRRPSSACIKDDGTLLAVLSTESQVDLYDLTQSPPKRKQSLIIDNPPRTIALSPCGTVLAAAYEGGIEVVNVRPDALATDRRAVKCDTVDSVAFSFDGTQILGTTHNANSIPPSTVVITAPYYDPSTSVEGSSSLLWTTSILFPNTSRDCSHSVLIQNTSRDEAAYAFTYDRNFETFRAVRVDDLRSSTTYFTGPLPHHQPSTNPKIMPCTIPAATYHGDLVSSGFSGRDIWVYGVPEDLDAIPRFLSKTRTEERLGGSLGRKNSSVSNRSSPGPASQVPQWQKLFDKHPNPNTFVRGFKIAELQGVSNVKFVRGYGGVNRIQERLVIAARGATVSVDKDDVNFVDGGRIMLVDFDYSPSTGGTRNLEIELGAVEAEVLEEEVRDLDTEVDIMRKRTVARSHGGARSSLLRVSASTGNPGPTPASPTPLSHVPEDSCSKDSPYEDDDPLTPRLINSSSFSTTAPPTGDVDEQPAEEEHWEAFDAPYSHQSPRSTNTLRRAATAAAASRRLRVTVSSETTQRRALRRREHPHESDADNWVPPPPPYHAEDPGTVPNFMLQPPVTPISNTGRPETLSSVPKRLSTIQGGDTPSTAARCPSRASMSTMSPMASPMSRTLTATNINQMIDADEVNETEEQLHSGIVTLAQEVASISATGDTVQGETEEQTDELYDVSPPQSPAVIAPTLPPNNRRSQSYDCELGLSQNARSLEAHTSLDERPVLQSLLDTRVTGPRRSLEIRPAGHRLSRDSRSVGPRLSLDRRSVSIGDSQGNRCRSVGPRRSFDPRSNFPPIVTTHRPAVPQMRTRPVSLTTQMRSASLPESHSSSISQSSPLPLGSSTFSPGGGDDYDPPAVWMSPRSTSSSFAVFTETPQPCPPPEPTQGASRCLPDDEISPTNTRAQSPAALTAGVSSNSNSATPKFLIPRVPVASRSLVEAPRSWSTILPPPPPHTHSYSSSHSRSFSGNLPVSSSSTSMQFTVMSDMPLLSSLTPARTFVVSDTPLLISTPSGITGGANSVHPGDATGRPEVPIVAPVARRPRPAGRRGVARRLEDSVESRISESSSRDMPPLPLFPPLSNEPAHLHEASARHLPSWLTSSTGLRHKSTTAMAVRRTRSNASRASRSAARNMHKAKQKNQKKSWSASTTGARRKKRGREADDASVSAWTDVPRAMTPAWMTTSATDRDGRNKCVVM